MPAPLGRRPCSVPLRYLESCAAGVYRDFRISVERRKREDVDELCVRIAPRNRVLILIRVPQKGRIVVEKLRALLHEISGPGIHREKFGKTGSEGFACSKQWEVLPPEFSLGGAGFGSRLGASAGVCGSVARRTWAFRASSLLAFRLTPRRASAATICSQSLTGAVWSSPKGCGISVSGRRPLRSGMSFENLLLAPPLSHKEKRRSFRPNDYDSLGTANSILNYVTEYLT